MLALTCEGGCQLLDEVHLCVLRTLAGNESPRDRKRRRLPLDLLDEVSVVVRMLYVLRVLVFCHVLTSSLISLPHPMHTHTDHVA